jgi:hypothetical protein
VSGNFSAFFDVIQHKKAYIQLISAIENKRKKEGQLI